MTKTIRCILIPSAFLLAGCVVPPIGMTPVGDETKMEYLAGASLLTERCVAAGFPAEPAAVAAEVARLSPSQRAAFERMCATAKVRRRIDDSFNAQNCANFAEDIRRLGRKAIIGL